MSHRSFASSRSPTAPARPSSQSAQVSWIARLFPPHVGYCWQRWAHIPLAVIGLWWAEPDAWPRYLVVTAILVLEWPFCIRLTQGVEVYMAVPRSGSWVGVVSWKSFIGTFLSREDSRS